MVFEITTEDKLQYKFFPNSTQALKFKVKAKNDAHVAITNVPRPEDPMYEIFIGGWQNSKIAIRRNKQKPEVAELPFPNTLNEGEFKEFWITWYNNAINVGVGNEPAPIIVWEDPNISQGQFFGICTGWGATGHWQIEDGWSGWRSPIQQLPPAAGPGWNIGSDPYPPVTGQPSWIAAANGEIPAGAVPGGFDNEQLYIGRARHDSGALLPGKVVPGHGCCYVPWGGQEHAIKEYEVLCGCQPGWVLVRGGEIPVAAVEAGKSESGEPLYVGRATHNETVTVGKVQKSHEACYIPYGGQEIAKDAYEVLVL